MGRQHKHLPHTKFALTAPASPALPYTWFSHGSLLASLSDPWPCSRGPTDWVKRRVRDSPTTRALALTDCELVRGGVTTLTVMLIKSCIGRFAMGIIHPPPLIVNLRAAPALFPAVSTAPHRLMLQSAPHELCTGIMELAHHQSPSLQCGSPRSRPHHCTESSAHIARYPQRNLYYGRPPLQAMRALDPCSDVQLHDRIRNMIAWRAGLAVRVGFPLEDDGAVHCRLATVLNTDYGHPRSHHPLPIDLGAFGGKMLL